MGSKLKRKGTRLTCSADKGKVVYRSSPRKRKVQWKLLETEQPRQFWCGTGFPRLTHVDREWAETFFDLSETTQWPLERLVDVAADMITEARKLNASVEDFYQWSVKTYKPWVIPSHPSVMIEYANSLRQDRKVIEVPPLPLQ